MDLGMEVCLRAREIHEPAMKSHWTPLGPQRVKHCRPPPIAECASFAGVDDGVRAIPVTGD